MNAKFDDSIYEKIKVSPDSMMVAVEDTEVEEYTKADSVKKLWVKIKPNLPHVLIWMSWIAIAAGIIVRVIDLVSAVIHINILYLNYNAILMLAEAFVPAGIWIFQSHYEYFGMYIRRKILTLCIAAISISITICQMLYAAGYYLLVPLIFKLPVTVDITASMIINLAKGVLACLVIGPGVWLIYSFFLRIFDKNNREAIEHFKVTRNMDLRKHKKFLYDAKFVRRVDDGHIYTIKEKDRFLHGLIDGTTGTGKTSGVFSAEITGDLNQKIYNIDYLKQKFFKLATKGDISLKKPFEDKDFNIYDFEPNTKKGKRQYNRYVTNVRDAGITVLAPNAPFCDEIYELASKRGLPVYRIDPTLDENGHHKPGYIGINPLYIDPRKTGLARRIEINAKACLFADVMQAVYDSGSKGDPYFASVNRNVTTAVTILLELTFEGFHGRQPNPEDVQAVCNNFDLAADYLQALKNMPGKSDYQFVIDFIELNILGPGRKKMDEQATGLRMLMNDLLINPLFKAVLCAEHTVDLDRILAEGAVTVVNYATELGMAQAKAFGMFFAFSFNNAVLRRPVKLRSPHFYFIDELPLLIHPNMELCFTYFRQFNVSTNVAIQSVDQFRKSPATAYFESVVLGNTGYQIFFGRISPQEMELVEKLGGVVEEIIEQESVQETAMSMENTQKSFTKRLTPQKVNRVDGGRARYLDFQQVYVFAVDEGNAVPPFKGKVNFVSRHERMKTKRVRFDWSKFKTNTKPLNDGPEKQVGQPLIRINNNIAETSRIRLNDLQEEHLKTETYILPDKDSNNNSDNNSDDNSDDFFFLQQ